MIETSHHTKYRATKPTRRVHQANASPIMFPCRGRSSLQSPLLLSLAVAAMLLSVMGPRPAFANSDGVASQVFKARCGPASIVEGPSGTMWFTEQCPGVIGVISASGGPIVEKTLRLPIPSTTVAGILTAPDRTFWFTVTTAGHVAAIGHIAADGQIAEYPAPFGTTNEPPVGGFGGSAIGPDGAFWFTGARSGKIGRVASDGSVKVYSILPPLPPLGKAEISEIYAGHAGLGFFDLGGITNAPDGALWFTEPLANKIGRIATDGSVTQYAIPTPSSGPGAITTGPDGALWFNEFTAGRIGRINLSGSITEFSVCYPIRVGTTEGCGPRGLVLGPDKALWFGTIPRGVGRITVDGSILSMDTPGLVTGLAAGPNGTLWLTVQSANDVIRFSAERIAAVGKLDRATRPLQEALHAMSPPVAARLFTQAQPRLNDMVRDYPGTDVANMAKYDLTAIEDELPVVEASPCDDGDFLKCAIEELQQLYPKLSPALAAIHHQDQAKSWLFEEEGPFVLVLAMAGMPTVATQAFQNAYAPPPVLVQRYQNFHPNLPPTSPAYNLHYTDLFGGSLSPMLSLYEALGAMGYSSEALSIADSFKSSPAYYVYFLAAIATASALTGHTNEARQVIKLGLAASAGTQGVADFAVAQALVGDAKAAMASLDRIPDPGQDAALLDQLAVGSALVTSDPDAAKVIADRVARETRALNPSSDVAAGLALLKVRLHELDPTEVLPPAVHHHHTVENCGAPAIGPRSVADIAMIAISAGQATVARDLLSECIASEVPQVAQGGIVPFSELPQSIKTLLALAGTLAAEKACVAGRC